MSRRDAAILLALSIAAVAIYFVVRSPEPSGGANQPLAGAAPSNSASQTDEVVTPETDLKKGADRACAIAVTVVDARKRAVSEASLKLMPSNAAFEVGNANSDENGRHVFTGIAPGSYRILVRDPRYRPGEAAAISCSGDGDPPAQTVVLEEGLVIAGRVVDETGAPVAGANVGSSIEASPIVTTDDQGRFELGGLDVGPVNVFATAPGYAPKQVRGLRGGTRNSELKLERPARARGRVETRGGAKSLMVSACQYDSYFSKEVCVVRRMVQPPELEFVLEPLPSGTFDVVFEADGHLTERVRVVLEAGKELVLRPVVLNVGVQTN